MFIPPLGFRFAPNEDEILHYLRRKVTGESLPEGIILDIDLYVNAPWDIFRKEFEDQWRHTSSTEFVIYVFTKLKKIGNKKRVVRRAGCGTWDGKTKTHEIYNGQKQLIGFKRMLDFEANVNNDEYSILSRGHWIMHEYSLGGVNLNGLESDGDYVVCKIKRDDSKFLRRAPKHVRELSKEENPCPKKKKKVQYDHDEASTITAQNTPTLKDQLELLPTPCSDFQPLLLPHHDDISTTTNSYQDLDQHELFPTPCSDFQPLLLPHDDDISTTMNSYQDLQQIEAFFDNCDFETDFFDSDMETRLNAFSKSLMFDHSFL